MGFAVRAMGSWFYIGSYTGHFHLGSCTGMFLMSENAAMPLQLAFADLRGQHKELVGGHVIVSY